MVMKPRVFISYSHADSEFVDRLAADLQGAEIDVWIDKWEINVGESIVARINAGIHESDFLIVVLSGHSVSSKWVMEELNAATVRNIEVTKGAFILPVLIEECSIPELLRHRKYADFQTDPNLAFEELKSAIRRQSSKSNESTSPDRSSASHTKRPAKRWFAVIGIGILAVSLTVGGLIIFRLVFNSHLPPYLQGIVKGQSLGTCAAENSGVQSFEHGWLVAQFLPAGIDHFYAIIDQGNGGLKWFKLKSDRHEGTETDCPGIRGAKLIRWGFRWWYCSEKAKPIRESLGQPITLETASWVQYQQWSAGLLVVGIPDLKQQDFEAGKWNVMVNAFLEDAQQQNEGWGRLSKVAPENINTCKVYCNAVWYYARYAPTEQGTEKTNYILLRESGCAKKHTDIEFIKPRPVCSLCLE
jgi:hypothetical protein